MSNADPFLARTPFSTGLPYPAIRLHPFRLVWKRLPTRRRTRSLHELSDRELRDIGLTRDDLAPLPPITRHVTFLAGLGPRAARERRRLDR